MVNYQNGKIYKIISPSTGLTYYGSTVEQLSVRMAKHRSDYKLQKGNITAFKVLACGDAKIYLVEKYPCDTSEELRAREGYYQQNFECVNYVISGRSHEQWRADNKEKIRARRRIQSVKNKEVNSLKTKQWRDENLERAKDKYKEWYQENREYVLSYKCSKIMCECGAVLNKGGMPKHRNTIAHQQYMLNPFGHM